MSDTAIIMGLLGFAFGVTMSLGIAICMVLCYGKEEDDDNRDADTKV